MSVSNTEKRSPAAGGYACNGSVTSFAGTFKVLAETDIQVVLTTAAGIETVLTLTTDYTTTPAGGAYPADTFTVTTSSAYASGNTITILRSMEFTQPTSYGNSGRYLPKNHETSFDREVLQIQQMQEEIDRCVKDAASATVATDPTSYLAACQTAASTATAALGGYPTAEKYLSAYGNLATAVASIGATEASLVIDQDDTLSANLTVPSNIHLRFVKSNVIATSTYTLTLNCPITAGVFQILNSTSGTVNGSPIFDQCYPQWFGAAMDGVTVDTTPLNDTIDFINAIGGGRVYLTGALLITTRIDKILEDIEFVGVRGVAKFTSATQTNLFFIFGNSTNYVKNVTFRGVTFEQTNTPTGLSADGSGKYIAPGLFDVYQAAAENLTFDECVFTAPNSPAGAINISVRVNNTDTTGSVDGLTVKNCLFEDMGGLGVSVLNRNHAAADKFDAATNVKIVNNTFRNMASYTTGSGAYGFIATMDGVGSKFDISGNHYQSATGINVSSVIELLVGWKDGSVTNNVVEIKGAGQPFLTTSVNPEQTTAVYEQQAYNISGNTFISPSTPFVAHDMNHSTISNNKCVYTATTGGGGLALRNCKGNLLDGNVVDWTAVTSIINQMLTFESSSTGNRYTNGVFITPTATGSGNLGENLTSSVGNIVKGVVGKDGAIINNNAAKRVNMSDADYTYNKPSVEKYIHLNVANTATRTLTLDEVHVAEGMFIKNETGQQVNITFTGAVNSYACASGVSAFVFVDVDANAIRAWAT